MSARALAQEAVSWYLSQLDPYASHRENVKTYLRGPVIALTLSLLYSSPVAAAPSSVTAAEEEKKGGDDWRDYLSSSTTTPGASEEYGAKANEKAYEGLHRRTKARLEALLAGISLMVMSESTETPNKKSPSPTNGNRAGHPKRGFKLPPKPAEGGSTNVESERHSFSLIEGLAGFRGFEKDSPTSPVLSSLNASRQTLLRSISSGGQSGSNPRLPQARESLLVTRLELYIRSVSRVKVSGEECVIAAETARALKARAQAIVTSFIDTVSTVRQQSPILTRLLTWSTRELLAVEYLSESLVREIRRLVSDYEQETSFASLAFLSSPDVAAEQRLTPMVLKYLKGLQSDWKNCVSDCELERMLSLSLDPEMRRLFKTIEFRSIGHLLETCAGYRSELQKINLPPGIGGSDDNPTAVHQAIRDLQRERITVNGHLLPPVTSRRELIDLLSQTLNSRTLTAAVPQPRRRRRTRKKPVRRSESAPAFTEISDSADADLSSSANDSDELAAGDEEIPKSNRSRRSFHLSTIDLLTKRLLLAASRTGAGGDAYFVVRDLFGGEDVEVVSSEILPTHGRAVRPGTIEILVKLASVTIKCHGSFDVYPKSMVRDCEPLIQLHTTTTETISLRECRASDSMSSNGSTHSDSMSSNGNHHSELQDDCGSDQQSVMVLQERITEQTGLRSLAIRPALYEKVEVWNTPS